MIRLSQDSLSISVPVFLQRGRIHYSSSKTLCPCDTSVINLGVSYTDVHYLIPDSNYCDYDRNMTSRICKG